MIKSGAVIQNRYLNNPYPTNHNPMGRPGNFDIARPYDSSSVFDTGIPKDVSPYQPSEFRLGHYSGRVDAVARRTVL